MIRELTINVAIIALLGLGALQVALAQNYRPMFPGSPTNVENFVQEMFFVTQSSGSLALRGTCMATDVASDVVSDALPHPPGRSIPQHRRATGRALASGSTSFVDSRWRGNAACTR